MSPRRLLIVFACCGLLCAQPKKEQPVGLVLAAQGGRLLRAGAELPLTAKPGDMVFTGDSLLSESGSVSFLFCPEKSSQTLPPNGEVLFEAKQLRVKKGSLSGAKPVEHCLLPQLVRAPEAGQQHYRSLEPAQGLPGTFESRLQALPEAQRTALQAALAPIDKTLAQNPKDQAARLARAAVLSQYGLAGDALEEYKKASAAWGDAEWTRQLIHEQVVAQDKAAPGPAGEGKTYALLIGISKYQRLTEEQQLRYAHADAELFAQHLRSPRGGSLQDDQIAVLTNEKATTAAIRTAIETFLKAKAGKKDTLIFFIAAHGTVVNGEAYIVTYDSDPQDLASTGLKMGDVQTVMQERVAKVGRVLVYVDACRAGIIGTIKNNTVNENLQTLLPEEGELLGFLASRPREYSIEAPRFGGGHGAFTYFLLRALNGDADQNKDSVVSANEVIKYVRDEVERATRNRQHPVDRVMYRDDLDLVDVTKQGIAIAEVTPATEEEGRSRFIPGIPRPKDEFLASIPQRSRAAAAEDLDLFEDALAGGRVLPETADSAFDPLRRLKRRLPPDQYLVFENRLRVALEDRGQQVLLRYLTGDQVPQSRSSFASGALYFQAAQLITPQSPFLESREAFCRGRVQVFDKQYPQAVDLLERAVRLDPSGAFSYNALGIAYLEQSDYARAIPAFRDASRRAPYWAYPLHNLALAYTEAGDSEAAIRSYEQAMRLAPSYSYLPYNLGLVYQRLNRRKDAEAAYRKTIALSPELGEPYNALGFLYASSGHPAEAERHYRQALEKNPNLLAARHNLALLLSEKRERTAEAIALWRDNLAKSQDDLPSRLSLAETLARQGNAPEAIEHYQAVLKLRPDYVAARLALAELLSRHGKADEALVELREALKRKPQNAAAHEQIGDIEKARGRSTEAAAAYQAALQYAADPKARKKIRAKMKS
ncbi:MAG: tetratricopeptide repeat protein [Acidobacteria bacterium]|nr:tetratricopeptide repeat protein [Acidobacteriota bacterium]